MKKLLRIVLGVLGGLLVLFVAVGFALPSSTHVERSTTIQATACNVSAMVDGFAWFNEFSPWASRDPGTGYTFSGPDHGVGAKMVWQSDNPDVGSGSQEVTAVEDCRSVTTALDFGSQGTATATWTLEPKGPSTFVTWSMDTDHGMNIISRYFGLLFDRMIGPDYEQGLAALKGLAEGLPKADIGGLEASIEDVEAEPMLAVDSRAANDAAAMSQALGGAYAQVTEVMRSAGLSAAGPPVALTTSHSADAWVFSAGIPFAGEAPSDVVPPVRVATTPEGRFLEVVHVGPYSDIGETHERIDSYVALMRIERLDATPSGVIEWERYISDPQVTPEDKLITHIFVPVK